MATPAAVGFDTLAGRWAIMERLHSGYGPNRLPAGEFEDLNAMMQAGWAHFQHPAAGIEARPIWRRWRSALVTWGYG